MGGAEIVSFKSDDALAAAVAEAWVSEINATHQQGRQHTVALSGGRITKKLFAEVVRRCQPDANALDCVHFFWADERCLPPDDSESNYRLAKELLFDPLQIPASRVHRIQGELTPESGAESATQELCEIASLSTAGLPILDLVLLGMGEDGHVASLFPDDAATESDITAVFLAVRNSPKPPPNRVSLGHGAIAEAREVWVLASGKGKEDAFEQSLAADGTTPLARVIQRRNRTRVFANILCD